MLSMSSLLLITSILSLWQIPESHSRSSISISSGKMAWWGRKAGKCCHRSPSMGTSEDPLIGV